MIGLIKTIKGKYRNGVIEPMEILEVPDGVEVTVTIDTTLLPLEEMKAEDLFLWMLKEVTKSFLVNGPELKLK